MAEMSKQSQEKKPTANFSYPSSAAVVVSGGHLSARFRCTSGLTVIENQRS